jgi:hypothetical protein
MVMLNTTGGEKEITYTSLISDLEGTAFHICRVCRTALQMQPLLPDGDPIPTPRRRKK